MSSNPFQIRVQPALDPPGLRLRAQPTTSSDTLAMEAPGTLLTVLETEASARPKIGVYGQWIQVRDANALEGYVAAWYVEAAPATSPSPSPQPPSPPTPAAPSAQSLVEAINAERLKRNVQPLNVNAILMTSAQKHAEFMASGGGITHYSADGSRPFQRHLALGYPLAGDLSRGGFASENIVAGSGMTIAQAIASWFGDEPHTNTMISDKYTECGAGVAVSGKVVYYCFDVARPLTVPPVATPPDAPASPARTEPVLTPAPAGRYVVYVPKTMTSGLRIRKQGSTSGALVRVAAAGEWLEVQESKTAAKAKMGVENKWLKVKDSKGNVGYVAAWLVSES